jgi:hypothetical protein
VSLQRKLWLVVGLASLVAGGSITAMGFPLVGGLVAGFNTGLAIVGIWKDIPFN